jgi:hypothetical protein
MEQVKKDFIKKYFTKYYIFGYFCLLGFIPQSALIYLATLLPYPINFLALSFLTVGSILLFRKWLLITCLSKKKYRFYKTAVEKLEIGKYDKYYFLNGMYDPCFRIIVKDLLYKYGLKDKYIELKQEKKIQEIPVYDERF